MIKFPSFFILLLLCSACSSQATPEIEKIKSSGDKIAEAAISIIDPSIFYDPSYRKLDYPNGDVNEKTGVCTDVVIRTYRLLGIDLQELVHEDMKENFHLYPKNWGMKKPDSNIDHRRVPNLMTFFSRFGIEKKITYELSDFNPGDILCWDLAGGITHIGIVSSEKANNGDPLIIHNIGSGQVSENVFFNWKMIGHYSFSH